MSSKLTPKENNALITVRSGLPISDGIQSPEGRSTGFLTCSRTRWTMQEHVLTPFLGLPEPLSVAAFDDRVRSCLKAFSIKAFEFVALSPTMPWPWLSAGTGLAQTDCNKLRTLTLLLFIFCIVLLPLSSPKTWGGSPRPVDSCMSKSYLISPPVRPAQHSYFLHSTSSVHFHFLRVPNRHSSWRLTFV